MFGAGCEGVCVRHAGNGLSSPRRLACSSTVAAIISRVLARPLPLSNLSVNAR